MICKGFGLLARAGVATAYLIYKTVHRNEFFWDQSIFTNEIPTKMYGFAKNYARVKRKILVHILRSCNLIDSLSRANKEYPLPSRASLLIVHLYRFLIRASPSIGFGNTREFWPLNSKVKKNSSYSKQPFFIHFC